MLHFSCDHCGKELRPGEERRFVVRIESHAADDPSEITEADLDVDHLQEVSKLLCDQEDEGIAVEETTSKFRYDLCPECHRRFVRDPLGKETVHKLYFSKN